MLKLVAPASVLAVLLAHAVLAGSAGVEVRMGTSETVAAACRLAPGFQSARLWQKAPDEDIYVRDVFADAARASGVRSAVARFKAELQDRALADMIDKRRVGFVPGRLTLGGCATYAAMDAADNAGNETMFPAFRVQ